MILVQRLFVRLTKLVKNRSMTLSAQQQQSIVTRKQTLLEKHPLVSNLTICIGFGALGDFIEQMRENFQKNRNNPIDSWDKVRTIKFAGAGVSVGFICHYWYNFLDKRFIELTWKNVVKKIFLCQFVHSPLCIVTFFMSIGYFNQWSRDEILKSIHEKGLILYEAEWIVWPPALLFSFYFLPTCYRVLFDSLVSLGFDILNSYLVYNDPKEALANSKKKKKQIVFIKKPVDTVTTASNDQ